MKNNKKLLMFLALNSLATSFAGITNQTEVKYDKLYNKMIKNIDLGKTNEINYKIIEKVLNQRNEELQDLYLQNDYIVKPEYLEWQVFFSNFYNNKNNKGKKSNYEIPIFPENAGKKITVEKILLLNKKNRDNLNLELEPIPKPFEKDFNFNLDVRKVLEKNMNIDNIAFPEIKVTRNGYAGGSGTILSTVGVSTNTVAYNTTGNKIYENLDVESNNNTTVTWDGSASNSVLISGKTDYSNISGGISGQTNETEVHLSPATTKLSVHNIGINGDFLLKGDWSLISEFEDTGNIKELAFLAYKPDYVTNSSSVTFDGDLTLNNKISGYADYSDYNRLIGLSVIQGRSNAIPQTIKMENKGNIYITSESAGRGYIAGIYADVYDSSLNGKIINSGNIFVGKKAAGEVYTNVTGIALTGPMDFYVKPGNIIVNNEANWAYGVYGLVLDNKRRGTEYSNLKIDGTEGEISVTGNGGTGVIIKSPVAASIDNNLFGGISNLNIFLNSPRNSAGFYGGVGKKGNTMPILNDKVIENIVVGPNNKLGILIYNAGDMVIDESLANSIKNNSGEDNTVIYISPSYNKRGLTENYMPITIGNGAKGGNGIFIDFGDVKNYGDITIDSKPGYYRSIGIGAVIGSYGSANIDNYGNITINSDNGIALYSNTYGSLNSTSGNIVLNGNNSIVFYSLRTGSGSGIYFNSGNIQLNGENDTIVYLDEYSNITIGTKDQAINAEINGKYSHFYYDGLKTNSSNVEILGDLNIDIKNGGYGFYYNSQSDIITRLSNIFNLTNGSININLDNDSYLFGFKNIDLNLSLLENFQVNGINITGSKKSYIIDSNLIVDIDSNLDLSNNLGNKLYGSSKISNSSVTINNNINVLGTEDNQAGIAQKSVLKNLNLINMGNISLSGTNTTGIYGSGDSISIINNGNINMQNATDGVGLYLKNNASSSISNNNEINIGKNGIGIYGDNNSYLSVFNNDKITGYGDNIVGIYINNNSALNNGKLYLNSNSNINLSDSKNGIGIYSNNMNISNLDSGIITVGENGMGMYLNNGVSNFGNLTLNLYGDNAVGIYTDGTNSFLGNGTINIDGKGILVYNIIGSGTFNQSFNIVTTANSSYTLANIKDHTLYSENEANLAQNGVYINGTNSAVLLGSNSKLISLDSNIIGLLLKGKYSSIPVLIQGHLVNQEATNMGIMNFGDDSIGIYVTEGASGENQGEIKLGNRSVGLYGTGGKVSNKGRINVGKESYGLFLGEGENILNTGIIAGIENSTVGMYSQTSTTTLLENNQTINLTGNGTIGIYTGGNGTNIINNTGTIVVGDSISSTDVSVGIYGNSSKSIINNSGTIKSGKESIGIYNKNGIVNNTHGNIEIGEKSTGIHIETGEVNLLSGILSFNGTDSVGVYANNNSKIDNNMLLNLSDDSYGIMLYSGSELINRNFSTVGERGVLIYSKGLNNVLNEINADIKLLGSNSVAFFMEEGGELINKALIEDNKGTGNIGIYMKDGSINNKGDIKVGDSEILSREDLTKNQYSVGIYGERLNKFSNSGNIEVGTDGIGIFSVESRSEGLNQGDIISNSDNAIGIYLGKSKMKNEGNIILSGNNSTGIWLLSASVIKNSGNITMNGDNSIGIYANMASTIINESTGKIFINGNNSTGIQLSGNSTLENYGLIEVAAGTINSTEIKSSESDYKIPSIINAGIIKVDEKFEMNGIDLIIKPDPGSFRVPTREEIIREDYALEDINGGFLLSNSVSIIAPKFEVGTDTVKIDPLFTQGTNARVYKFENVFDPLTPEGGFNDGELTVKSNSLTFDAIPVINKSGKVDIWMEKIDYSEFTKGTWYDDFAKNIEGNYLNATGNPLKLYDKLDLITNVNDLITSFEQLAGNVYANINQRENDIAETFENSLHLLQDSKNNTKENVKINIITGKGKSTEETSGVLDYNYTTTGVQILREVERTYRHTFGYSLGYAHTNFEFEDGNKSKELADTIQLGVHNKYMLNSWELRNDLTGRVSLYNIDRNINWNNGERTELNGHYETYSMTSDNRLGKELSLGRQASITPYGGLKAIYMTRDSFKEKGTEGLEVKGNDAWSVKPRAGVELKGNLPLGSNTGWQLKGSLDVAYEYELAGLEKEERAKLSLLEDDYHKLSKPEEDKGKLRTKAAIGVEAEDRYGIFLTGEYSIGNHNKDDYRAGITLKAVF